MKTEEGGKVSEKLKEKIAEKASEYGIAKEYKTAVTIAKAIL